jgi:hypothetical protein
MDIAIRDATIWTVVWVAVLGIPMLLAMCGVRVFSYSVYHTLRLLGAIVLLFLALYSIYTLAQLIAQPLATKATAPWYTHGTMLSLVVFWALFPPLWFFAEYYFVDSGFVAPPPGTTKEDLLSSLKSYADFASKIWAAVGALLAVLLALLK